MTNEAMLKLVKDFMKCNDYSKLEKLEAGLIENIRDEVEVGKGTRKKDLSIIKEITKQERYGNENKTWNTYHPFTYDGIEYKAFLQGNYILASQNDFGYKEDEHPFKINAMIADNAFSGIELKVDLKDVVTFQKTISKNDKKPYIIETEKIKIGFNPWYLADALMFNETDTLYVSTPKAPAYFRNEEKKTIGVVLPINLNTI